MFDNFIPTELPQRSGDDRGAAARRQEQTVASAHHHRTARADPGAARPGARPSTLIAPASTCPHVEDAAKSRPESGARGARRTLRTYPGSTTPSRPHQRANDRVVVAVGGAHSDCW